jgi:hypothetical protein
MATLLSPREGAIEIVGSTIENGELKLVWRAIDDRTRSGTITIAELLELAPSAVPF